MGKYIIGIDQSTQGTKALIFDEQGTCSQEQISLIDRLLMTKAG